MTWPLENEAKGQMKKVGNLTLVLTANIPNIDALPERISESLRSADEHFVASSSRSTISKM